MRLKKRLHEGLYYNKETADWCQQGYTVWTIAEWNGTFNAGRAVPDDVKEWVDAEGRLWQFFGYVIPLYDEGEKT